MIARYFLLMFFSLLSHEVFSAQHHPAHFLRSIAGSSDEGEQIVSHFCAVCHAEQPQISIGAPRAHHLEDWKPRLKQGFRFLFQHTEEGLGAMPPRGGCFECTDQQLMLAIKSLIGKKGLLLIK